MMIATTEIERFRIDMIPQYANVSDMDIRAIIRDELARQSMTQVRFGELTDLTPSRVSDYLTGKRDVRAGDAGANAGRTRPGDHAEATPAKPAERGQVMASLINDPGGKKRIQYVDRERKRQTIRLGKMARRTAESIHFRVEKLIESHMIGTAVDRDTALWVADLSDALHERIARVGLVEPREAVEAMTLGGLLDRFDAHLNVQASTRAAYKQAMDSLRAHFDEAKPIEDLTPVDADDWHKAQRESGLAPPTVAKRVKVVRAIFGKALRWRLIDENPFQDVRAGSQTNPAKAFYVASETIQRVLDACPDDEWRAIIGLARFAGLRCPSEIVGLAWGDVDWEHGRLTVRSPKTARYEGRAARVVPIVPELRAILLRLFDAAEAGSEWIVPRLRDPKMNRRTTLLRIIARAGEKPWPKLFQNMRASCETDWVEEYPAHVAAGWMGHSPTIAAKHYTMTLDAHFERAVAGGKAAQKAAQNAAQQAHATPCGDVRSSKRIDQKTPVNTGANASERVVAHGRKKRKMGLVGLEPT